MRGKHWLAIHFFAVTALAGMAACGGDDGGGPIGPGDPGGSPGPSGATITIASGRVSLARFGWLSKAVGPAAARGSKKAAKKAARHKRRAS